MWTPESFMSALNSIFKSNSSTVTLAVQEEGDGWQIQIDNVLCIALHDWHTWHLSSAHSAHYYVKR